MYLYIYVHEIHIYIYVRIYTHIYDMHIYIQSLEPGNSLPYDKSVSFKKWPLFAAMRMVHHHDSTSAC